ncbi:MAG: bifunctional glutamate N-acetyltransferase/amino-acid acetyltransferase ArgJ [Planktomarina sp.]|nr:bifunctional glutamate N-acetyltransferase/amino-acid acetyltransferase ArgJ [Planktomarina sp.]
MKKSSLAPDFFPELPIIKGVQFATGQTGIKYINREDVMLAKLSPGTTVSGVFTRSTTRSASVLDCQSKIGFSTDQGAAILVNAGNANAFTGSSGQASVDRICEALSATLDLPKSAIFTSSTGVIGEILPDHKITDCINELKNTLSDQSIESAASAIMTTDTFPKGSSATLDIDGKKVCISGIAKGSGMIAPDMATMLVYIFTDAEIGQIDLQKLLQDLTNRTFNCITVDSDTSTSDSLICAATGTSGVDVSKSSKFSQSLESVMLDLAQQVVRDGEGATKFITVNVTGAASNKDAHRVAMATANSPLVKTAMAGEDPNWGRIVMAVGKSGALVNCDLLTIWFGSHLVAENGRVAKNYKETFVAKYMKQSSLSISIDLGMGNSLSTVWTCDLTNGYIKINADYRS